MLPGSGSPTISYGYNLRGDLTSETAPGASNSITYGYNLDNQVQSITDPSGNTNDVTGYSYNPDGNLQQVTYPTGAAQKYAYDPMQRVSSITNYAGNGSGGQGASINSLTYGYDAASNVLNITDQNNKESVFTYDGLNRLQTENIPSGFLISGSPAVNNTYTYDAGGNLSTLQQADSGTSGETTTYGYNSIDELSTAANNVTGTTSYYYNSDGQLTSEALPGSGGTTSFTYDPQGNLLTAGADTYTYNIDSQRVGTSNSVSGNTTQQVFDSSGNVIQQNLNGGAGSSGGSTQTYMWGPNGVAEAGTQSSAGAFSSASYYNEDALGSVIGLTSASSGSATQAYEYDAYGKCLSQ